MLNALGYLFNEVYIGYIFNAAYIFNGYIFYEVYIGYIFNGYIFYEVYIGYIFNALDRCVRQWMYKMKVRCTVYVCNYI